MSKTDSNTSTTQRDTYVRLSIQSIDVRFIAITNSHVAASAGCLIIAIVIPGHPVQCALDVAEISLAGVEVRREENFGAGSGLHLVDVKAVSCK